MSITISTPPSLPSAVKLSDTSQKYLREKNVTFSAADDKSDALKANFSKVYKDGKTINTAFSVKTHDDGSVTVLKQVTDRNGEVRVREQNLNAGQVTAMKERLEAAESSYYTGSGRKGPVMSKLAMLLDAVV